MPKTLRQDTQVRGHGASRKQLIHFIDDGPANGFASGAYREQLPAGDPFPTTITWWTSNGGSKIIELTITWSGALITQEVWVLYEEDGVTPSVTVTDVYTYTNAIESERTRTIA